LIGSTWSKFFGYSVSPSDLETYLAGPLSVSSIQADIENALMRIIVAVSPEDQNIIGVAQLVTGTTESYLKGTKPIELRRIYVDENHHGKGVANALIDSTAALSVDEGYDTMWLGVWENNPKAQRFYEKMGFHTVGEHTFLVGESVRKDWVMEKRII